MTLEPVSRPYNQRGGVRSSGRAPAPPITLGEAARRLEVASGAEDKQAAVVDVVHALVREPSIAGAVALARMAEVARHGGLTEMAGWLDQQVERVQVESQRTLVEEIMRLAGAEFMKQTMEVITREVGEGRMREIQLAISGKKESTGGKK